MRRLLLFLILLGSQLFAQENTHIVVETGGHMGLVKSVVFSPDGKFLYSFSDDKTVRMWDVENGVLINTYRGYIERGPVGMCNSGAISPDGNFLAIGGYLGEGKDIGIVRVLDPTTGSFIGYNRVNNASVVSMEFSKDGRGMVAGDNEGKVSVWNIESGNVILFEAHDEGVYATGISPNGKKLVTGSFDGTVKIWDFNTALKMKRKDGKLCENGHTAEVRNVDWSPDGKYFVTVGFDNRILLWNAKGKLVKEIDHVLDEEYGEYFGIGDLNCISFSEDGTKIVVGTRLNNNQNAIVYAIPSGEKLLTFDRHNSSVISCAIHGDMVATAGGQDREIFIWDINTGDVIAEFKGNGKRVWEVGALSGYKVALGNYTTGTFINNTGELNMAFDLSTLEFIEEDLTEATGEVRRYNNLSLDYTGENPFAVYISNGEMIELDPGYHGDVRCYSFTPNGNIVVGAAYRLTLFDTLGNMVQEYAGHSAEVNGIAFSDDGRFMYSGSSDQTMRIWDLNEEAKLPKTKEEYLAELEEEFGKKAIKNFLAEKGEEAFLELYDLAVKPMVLPFANLFVSANQEWILWTRENYYATSRYGSRFVGFHINQGITESAKFYAFEQFDVKYNRPDKVLEILGTGSDELKNIYKHAYEKRLEKLNIKSEDLSDTIHAPTLEMKTISHATNEDKIKLKFNIKDSKYKIRKIYVTNNDVPSQGRTGMDITSLDVSFMVYNMKENLLPGKNRIQVWCVNEKGISSNRETVNIYCSKKSNKPDLYIIGIAASEYENDQWNLNYATKDVRDFVSFYADNNNLYNKVSVDTLFNENVTLANIQSSIEKLKKTSIGDHVIFYVAGHGVLNAELDYYLATYDMNFNLPDEKGFAYALLEEKIEEIPARTKTIFIDACHSGELDKSSVEFGDSLSFEEGDIKFRSVGASVQNKSGISYANSFQVMKNKFADLRQSSGATIVASAGGAEFAFEGAEWENGVFTYVMLMGLKNMEADLDQDGLIYLSELQVYVRAKVSEITLGKQQPMSRYENISNDYVFWQ